MAIDRDAVARTSFTEAELSYGETETLLYALSLGLGAYGADPGWLRYVYEKNLIVLPTLLPAVGWDNDWVQRLGLDSGKVLHLRQELLCWAPAAVAARLRLRRRLAGVYDRGVGRGAIVVHETEIFDADRSRRLMTSRLTALARGDGGFGGVPPPARTELPAPSGEPLIVEHHTSVDQALLYRLTGDRNPLHVDPAIARAAGFEAPILHGMCTLGMAVAAATRVVAEDNPARIARIAARFSSPVFPGETLHTEIWRTATGCRFRTATRDGRTVLDDGIVALAGAVASTEETAPANLEEARHAELA